MSSPATFSELLAACVGLNPHEDADGPFVDDLIEAGATASVARFKWRNEIAARLAMVEHGAIPATADGFADAVDQFQAAGMSRPDAIKLAAIERPDLHLAFKKSGGKWLA